MKAILTILFIYLISFSTKPVILFGSSFKSKVVIESNESKMIYDSLYENTIAFIKQHEGFRANWYNDNGYEAIGYGQRRVCFKGTIIAPIDSITADFILRISFREHQRNVDRFYGKLPRTKKLALSHLSYCIGIGSIIKRKIVNGNELNVNNLMKLPHKNNRNFEIELWKKK
jgi:GH24 family phage-related lysozyme (muramidase)